MHTSEVTPAVQPELFIFNELCALKDDSGPCKAIKHRFFFNVDAGVCQLFEYGGCAGNANNFLTMEECEETCVVSGFLSSSFSDASLTPRGAALWRPEEVSWRLS
ncbi:Kunitz-type serine protease inhibitor bitisilin-1 [Liparis tanakae]|uniref:Kunitz-type serine protease inhibitor bitisilin-1 n=1 Tax=Liparis tanakae TaxID=230148 RepID=A0A4Z2FTV5_9TELE|nr:Kunitz-type serine protease inhibitor bitisilin-1 [Liparis tanakae]